MENIEVKSIIKPKKEKEIETEFINGLNGLELSRSSNEVKVEGIKEEKITEIAELKKDIVIFQEKVDGRVVNYYTFSYDDFVALQNLLDRVQAALK